MKIWTIGNTLQAGAILLTMIITLLVTPKPASSISTILWTYAALIIVLIMVIGWQHRRELKTAVAAAQASEAATLQDKLDASEKERDRAETLAAKLIMQSLQNNIPGGAFPAWAGYEHLFVRLWKQGRLLQEPGGLYRLLPSGSGGTYGKSSHC
jgi:hypothetical protein